MRLRTRRKHKNTKDRDSDSDSDSDSYSDSDNIVKTIGSDVFFHADVNRKNIFSLIENIRKLEIELLKKTIDLIDYTPHIRIFIHSDGGDAYAGLSGMDHIKNSKIVSVIINIICDMFFF